ncbi:Aste57867_11981 [Aphanomyces stellatus]|uniref:Aste57867_11981 protein n=1 Tax=Aphanomyces stellatus TaxID=120398 RepID=A0A485KV67_9STRA|nr:hypothetical protein As57867_011936 [Aphanomyces stellatus]VFT88836.1 Aste57867_11981 [Aphanomyces stellatus]
MAAKSSDTQKPKIWLLDDRDIGVGSTRTAASDSNFTNLSYDQDYCIIMDKRLSESRDTDLEKDLTTDFGALRSGGALNLLSWEAFALLSQYAGVGILMGVFGALQYPLFLNYLHMEGYQTASYNVLTSLGWSSKIFFGMISDCFPIFGYQRRPYMVIGWLLCAVCCLLMAITPFPAPYYGTDDLALRQPNKTELTANESKFINLEAPSSAGFFIVMSMLASLGYVLADAAADAMVVQYAQREPAAIRGRVQTAIYFTRDTFSMVPTLLVGFCMNGVKFGGTFSWSISPNLVYAILVVPCVLAAYSAFALMVEEKVDRTSFTQYLRNTWMLLQQRVVWQICAFKFFNTVFYSYISTLNDPVASNWVGVNPVVSSAFSILYQIIRVGAMFGIGKYALNWDWRASIALSTVVVVVYDGVLNFLAIWGVMRNQFFQSGLSNLEAIPDAAIFLFGGYLLVEIAEVGNEGLVYALLTSVQNLAIPLSTVLAKSVDSYFDANVDAMKQDDTAVRWQVSYAFIAQAGFKLFSLVFLVLMPRQKAYVQVLKRTGSLSRVAAATVVFVFFAGYIYNLTTNIMSIYPSTACLRIAGGKGCPLPGETDTESK